MKLSPHLQQVQKAFDALMASYDDLNPIQDLHRDIPSTCIRRDIPRARSKLVIPKIIPTYIPMTPLRDAIYNKEKLLLLATFEATYHGSPTPISPDMVPIVIDTGPSVTVTPYITDFVSPSKPVQAVEIKGIASGLQVAGYGDIRYDFHNDAGETQTMLLKDCLYVPKCSPRLLCPRQLGITSKHSSDGFNALSDTSILTFQGKPTTIQYDKISNLPILYTAPGLNSYHRFCANQCYLSPATSPSPSNPRQYQYNNLTRNQQ